jgi:hypothetical protein
MIPNQLTLEIRSAIMSSETTEEKRIESKLEISTYLDRLSYALSNNQVRLQFQENRQVDALRDKKYTNRFTVAKLFPNEDITVVLKRELSKLDLEDYIETVKDRKFKDRSEMRVFGKVYAGEDIYIKIRVELIKSGLTGVENYIFVMSFHYAKTPFNDADFPYSKKVGAKENEDY